MKNYGYALIVVLSFGSVLFAAGGKEEKESEGTANWYDWGRVRDWSKRQMGDLYQNIPTAYYPGIAAGAYGLGRIVKAAYPVNVRATIADYMSRPLGKGLSDLYGMRPEKIAAAAEGMLRRRLAGQTDFATLYGSTPNEVNYLINLIKNTYLGYVLSDDVGSLYKKLIAQKMADLSSGKRWLLAGAALAAMPYAYNWYKSRVDQQKIAQWSAYIDTRDASNATNAIDWVNKFQELEPTLKRSRDINNILNAFQQNVNFFKAALELKKNEGVSASFAGNHFVDFLRNIVNQINYVYGVNMPTTCIIMNGG